jgi:hypothetical protein
MNIVKKYLLFITILAGSFITIAGTNTAHAALFGGAKDEACKGANLSDSNANCQSDEAAVKINNTVQAIVNILSVIIGIVAVISIIGYGLKFVTSGGDSNGVGAAKKWYHLCCSGPHHCCPGPSNCSLCAIKDIKDRHEIFSKTISGNDIDSRSWSFFGRCI